MNLDTEQPIILLHVSKNAKKKPKLCHRESSNNAKFIQGFAVLDQKSSGSVLHRGRNTWGGTSGLAETKRKISRNGCRKTKSS